MARVHTLRIDKGPETYVFVYDTDPDSRTAYLDALLRFARDPDLSFTWYDAACASSPPGTESDMEPLDPTIERQANRIAAQLAPTPLFGDFGLSLLVTLLTTFLPSILKRWCGEEQPPTPATLKESVQSHYNAETGEFDPRVINQLARQAQHADLERRRKEGHRGRKGKLSQRQAKAVARVTLMNVLTADEPDLELFSAAAVACSVPPAGD